MIALACLLLAQMPFERDLVETKDGAVVLLAPRHAAGPWVQDWKWSKDGRYLAAIVPEGGDDMIRMESAAKQERAPAESTSVMVYDTKTGSSTRIFESKGSPISWLDWMPGSAVFWLAWTNPPLKSIYRWRPGSAAEEVVRADQSKRPLQFLVSPTHPYGLAFIGIIAVEGKSWLLNPSGPTKELDLPNGLLRSGETGHIFLGSGPPQGAAYRIETDGKLTKVPSLPGDVGSAELLPGLVAQEGKVNAALGAVKVQHSQAWMLDTRAENSVRALVAAEAEDVRLAPGNQHVAYMTQHNLFVRQLKHLTASEYEGLRDRADQVRLMQQAQQVSSAFQIYAADNKDNLPTKEKFVDAISPFLRNVGSLQGFVYQMNGDKYSDIKDPANTVFGYTQGRKGRAVAYADGSVRWVPNP